MYSDHKISECNTKFNTDNITPEPETLCIPHPENSPQAEFDNLNFFSEDIKWDEIDNELSKVS